MPGTHLNKHNSSFICGSKLSNWCETRILIAVSRSFLVIRENVQI